MLIKPIRKNGPNDSNNGSESSKGLHSANSHRGTFSFIVPGIVTFIQVFFASLLQPYSGKKKSRQRQMTYLPFMSIMVGINS